MINVMQFGSAILSCLLYVIYSTFLYFFIISDMWKLRFHYRLETRGLDRVTYRVPSLIVCCSLNRSGAFQEHQPAGYGVFSEGDHGSYFLLLCF